MVDKKNIVDDYYANISSEISNKEEENVVKVVKIKVKKKTSLDEVILNEEKNQKEEIKEELKIKPKNIIQKIKVVKKVEKEQQKNEQQENKKPIIDKPTYGAWKGTTKSVFKVEKKENRFPKQENTEKREQFVVVKKWDIKEKTFEKNNNNQFFKQTDNKTKDSVDLKKWFKARSFKKQDGEEENKKSKSFKFIDKRTRWRVNFLDDKEVNFVRSNKISKKQKEEKNVEDIKQNLTDHKWETIIVPDILNLKEFSEKIWVALPKLIAEFMKNWMMLNINSKIDFESACIIAESFEIKLERDSSLWSKIEDVLTWDLSNLIIEDDLSKLKNRSPVVSIMWHVDHWKTSLLDYIRKTKVTTWEAWWITQSIWAYQVELENWRITFLDTPWHEAFTIMRARWAKLTDIAVLVVAADEWVKPQTIESINHAKEAWIPVIVAINKMDKVWANPDFVKWQLADNWLIAEDWGWDVPMVPVSALTWFWIEELLEMILIVTEMLELKANPDRNWICTVIESHLDNKFWPVITALINTWTVKVWDNIVCQDSYWKIKILKNYSSQNIKSASVWEPILIVWLDKVFNGWDILQVVSSQEVAKQKASEYRTIMLTQKAKSTSGLDLLMSKIKAWSLKQLKIIVKADTNGSLEAIKWALVKLSTPETTVSVIHSWVWSINEWDVLMWQWWDTILIWYSVWILPTAKWIFDSSWVEFISSDIIYHITEKIEKIVTWMLDTKEIEIILCRAKVLEIFYNSKEFMVLGLSINKEEKIEHKTKIRVIRNKKMIWTWKVDSLKSWTLDVKQLEWPLECWIKFIWNVSVEKWDELEIYKVEIQK